MTQPLHVLGEFVGDLQWLVPFAWNGVDPAEEGVATLGWHTLDLDRPDHRAGAGGHVELEESAIRIVPLRCARHDRRRKKPTIVIELFEESRDLLCSSWRWRRAEPVRDRVTQQVFRQGQR